MNDSPVASEGDLEVVILHEAHEALSSLISPKLYSISGSPSQQTAVFHSEPAFDLFLVLLIEVFAEGTQVAHFAGQWHNFSLLTGLQWFSSKHPNEAAACGLDSSLAKLTQWIDHKVPIDFWCPEVDRHVELSISNYRLIWFGANRSKHHLLRSTRLLAKLGTLSKSSGYSFLSQEMLSVLDALIREARSRLEYHSTYILELLGNVFYSLNEIILSRFNKNPTNKVSEMTMPIGITSDIFRDMYGSVLVFKRYSENRILDNTLTTGDLLKNRY